MLIFINFIGKLVALRFLEWVKDNPEGVIALPTGRTPEFFIKTLEHLKKTMPDFPETSKLRFVMLDEFFPMLPTHRNSFCNYIDHFYTSMLSIKKENVYSFDLIGKNVISPDDMRLFQQGVDLTLLTREAVNDAESQCKAVLLKVQAYCVKFEETIRSLGGIGFFLGGIGPDGHIAFNQEGSDHQSITRLVNFNYPTAAAAAGDLGGIEIAKTKAAMTIGLGTISFSMNPERSTVIIMAAGEGKANVVRAAIEDEISPQRPASVLQNIPGGRFYITHGAANQLRARKAETLASIETNKVVSWALNHLSGISIGEGIDNAYMVVPPKDYLLAEDLIHNMSLKTGKPIHKLVVTDLDALPEAAATPSYLRNELAFNVLTACSSRRLREKIEGGLKFASTTDTHIVHTAPHHDDIMLSYHAAMHEMLGRQPAGTFFNNNNNRSGGQGNDSFDDLSSNGAATRRSRSNSLTKAGLRRSRSGSFAAGGGSGPNVLGEIHNGNLNYFAYLTSGFHSVNDSFLQKQTEVVSGPNGTWEFLSHIVTSGEMTRDYDDLMASFYEAFYRRDEDAQDQVERTIFLRKVAEVWNINVTQKYDTLIQQLRERVQYLIDEYIHKHQPGDAIPKDIQILKGCMRESEVDRVWALSKMPMNRISHMRSKFYNDDFFTPMPSLVDDALPFANLLRIRQPEIITVAFDPEGTGPDTHYKVLQVVAAGLRISLEKKELENDNPVVIGYRNVWFVFTPSDATLLIPGSEADLNLMHDTFMSCFTTQKAASFPSPHYDGPFSAWARHLQIQQKDQLKTLLGEDYFLNHKDMRVRNAKGFVFLKAMYADHFLQEVEELKSKFEIVSK